MLRADRPAYAEARRREREAKTNAEAQKWSRFGP
jgi:hypothetical protein